MTEGSSAYKWTKLLKHLNEADNNEEEENRNEKQEDDNISKLGDTEDNSKTISFNWLENILGRPTSRQGYLAYMFIMILIPLLPITALITQNVINLNSIIARRADLIDSDNSVEKSDETARFIANMQQERSIALMLTFLDDDFDAETKKINFDIDTQMLKTDVALENISDWRSPDGVDILRSKLRLQIRIDDFRELQQDRKSRKNEVVAFEILQFYTFVTRVLLDDMSAIIRSSNGSSTWRYLVTYKGRNI